MYNRDKSHETSIQSLTFHSKLIKIVDWIITYGIHNQLILGYRNGHDLADTAVKAIEGGALTSNANPSRSTLIIHSVQRVRIFYLSFSKN